MKRRLLMTFVGLFFLAVGMGLFKALHLGVDPYSGFATGLAYYLQKIGLKFCSYSFVFSVMTAMLFIWIFFYDRHFLHLGTVIHILFVGKITEVVQQIFEPLLYHVPLVQRMIVLIGAFLIFSIASAIYYSADMGVSAYDAVSLALYDKKIMPYQYARILTDLLCLILGTVFGALALGIEGVIGTQVGIGTVLTALAMGPTVQLFRNRYTDAFAAGARKEKQRADC